MIREQLEQLYRRHLEEFQRTATAITGDRESGKRGIRTTQPIAENPRSALFAAINLVETPL
jgi:hypothetical protein